MGVRSGGSGWVGGAREWARQMCRRRSGASTRGGQVAWRHAWPWRRCATWWRDGPDAARACCAWRACVREAAHVRLGATMAIELAEKRNAIVCVGVVAWKVDGWDRGKCPDASSRHFRKSLFLVVFAEGGGNVSMSVLSRRRFWRAFGGQAAFPHVDTVPRNPVRTNE